MNTLPQSLWARRPQPRTLAGLGLLLVLFTLFAACRDYLDNQRVDAPALSVTTGASPAPTGGAGASYADVVSRVAPAVVTIRSERRARAPQQHPFFNDPLFGDLFGGGAPPRERVQRGLGSGVLVTADGYLLTNQHVVDGAEGIRVELADNRQLDARVIGADAPSDLAVLKINANSLPVLTLGDSDRVRVGDIVLAAGNPLGVGQTVTAGIISAKGRTTGLSDGSFESFLQTDAPINQGNSGGALVNTAGELIGINSQILSPTGGNIGIGFAIPSNMARSVMEQLVKGGKVRRGQLGVTIQPLTAELAAGLGLSNPRGVLVSGVTPGGAAQRAGLRQGDVITAFNGTPVSDSNTLRNQIAATAPGTEVTLTLVRDNQEQQVRATLGEFTAPAAPANVPAGSAPGEGGKLGLSVTPLTPELANQLGLPRGAPGLAVTDVDPAGPAAEGGVRPGDVLEQVNRQPVRAAAELTAVLARGGDRPALLLVNRRGNHLFLTVRPRG